MKNHYSVSVKNRVYPYQIKFETEDSELCFFECEGAGISQFYPKEDIHLLLKDLPELILDQEQIESEEKAKETKLYFRVKPSEKTFIQKRAIRSGFANTSDYLRNLALGTI